MTPASGLDLRQVTILVVEDSGFTARLLKTVLEEFGVGKVVECDDALRVLAGIRETKPDIVILDRHLQRLDGLELTRQIRRSPGLNPALPIILLSAEVTRDEVADARDAGVTEFLAKPITARAVQDRVLHCLMMPRRFIRSGSFRGPDRRRNTRPYAGVERRAARRAPQPTA
jgi:CheY-like chemotaxis protein